jgi:hypothetical protein
VYDHGGRHRAHGRLRAKAGETGRQAVEAEIRAWAGEMVSTLRLLSESSGPLGSHAVRSIVIEVERGLVGGSAGVPLGLLRSSRATRSNVTSAAITKRQIDGFSRFPRPVLLGSGRDHKEITGNETVLGGFRSRSLQRPDHCRSHNPEEPTTAHRSKRSRLHVSWKPSDAGKIGGDKEGYWPILGPQLLLRPPRCDSLLAGRKSSSVSFQGKAAVIFAWLKKANASKFFAESFIQQRSTPR